MDDQRGIFRIMRMNHVDNLIVNGFPIFVLQSEDLADDRANHQCQTANPSDFIRNIDNAVCSGCHDLLVD